MSNVINLDNKKHIYDIENCAGCGKPIDGEYTELGLPSGDGKEVKHIALCGDCGDIAKGEGVF